MDRRPKVELHLHLDCSLSYSVVAALSPGVTRSEYDAEFIAPPKCTSLADFLTRAPRGFQLMQTEDAIRLVMEDLFQQLAADNAIYAEIRFAPLLHSLNGLTPERAVAAADRATEACIRATGIEARLILCTLRHFSEQQSMETALLVERFRGSSVVALDLAADEAGFPIDAHIPAFRHALEKDLYRTAHAGEAAGAVSVWETLRVLKPTRLGHGVRTMEDPALVEYVKRHGIHLEVCPTSNVQTGVCDTYRDHPIDALYRCGVSLGINTDARTMANITLSEEYRRLENHFDWGAPEFLACNRAALRAAFLEEPVRKKLEAQLVSAYD